MKSFILGAFLGLAVGMSAFSEDLSDYLKKNKVSVDMPKKATVAEYFEELSRAIAKAPNPRKITFLLSDSVKKSSVERLYSIIGPIETLIRYPCMAYKLKFEIVNEEVIAVAAKGEKLPGVKVITKEYQGPFLIGYRDLQKRLPVYCLSAGDIQRELGKRGMLPDVALAFKRKKNSSVATLQVSGTAREVIQLEKLLKETFGSDLRRESN